MTACRHKQQGAAHLVMAMAISMSVTLVTLAVARTQLDEQRLSANSQWHIRLSLAAQSTWHEHAATLARDFDSIDWIDDGTGSVATFDQTDTTQGTHTRANLFRRQPDYRLIDLQAIAYRNDGSKQHASYRQTVRLLSILTPSAESAPPLILNGCVATSSRSLDIRPRFSDSDQAQDAVWLSADEPCPTDVTLDAHHGAIETKRFRDSLWSAMFSVDQEEFLALATAEQNLPVDQRRYWVVGPDIPGNTQWRLSLGRIDKPVAIYFPAEVGCPQFADGVAIVGIVYIDTDCHGTLADTLLQITGTLVINGNLDPGNADIRLNHIQVLDEKRHFLDFPPLYSVRIPGSWRDF